jgi:hypothetical protein
MRLPLYAFRSPAVFFIKAPRTEIVLEYPPFRNAHGRLKQTAADPVVPVVRQHVERVELMAVESDKAHQLIDVVHLSHEYLTGKIPPPFERLSPREFPTWREDAGVGSYG